MAARPRRSRPGRPDRRASRRRARARSATAAPANANATTTKATRLIEAGVGERLIRGSSDAASRRSSRSRPGPSARAVAARIATAPPSAATRPAVTSCSSAIGRTAQARPDEERATEQQAEPDADAQDVAPGHDRQDRQRRQREPGRLPRPPDRAPARRARGYRIRRRRPRRRGTRPSASRRASRPVRTHGRRARDPQEVAGQHRGDETSGESDRCRGRIGQERRPDQRDDEPEDRRPRVPGGPGHDGSDHDRERDPREGRVHGGPLMGGWCQLRVGRRREDPEDVDRPVAQPGPADDLLDSGRARTSANRPSSRDGRPSGTARRSGSTHRFSSPGTVVGWAGPSGCVEDVRLVERRAVDEDVAVRGSRPCRRRRR